MTSPSNRALRRPGAFVGALVGERVEDIGDRRDAGGERDVGRVQAGELAGAARYHHERWDDVGCGPQDE